MAKESLGDQAVDEARSEWPALWGVGDVTCDFLGLPKSFELYVQMGDSDSSIAVIWRSCQRWTPLVGQFDS